MKHNFSNELSKYVRPDYQNQHPLPIASIPIPRQRDAASGLHILQGIVWPTLPFAPTPIAGQLDLAATPGEHQRPVAKSDPKRWYAPGR